jgi:hypothetical protein
MTIFPEHLRPLASIWQSLKQLTTLQIGNEPNLPPICFDDIVFPVTLKRLLIAVKLSTDGQYSQILRVLNELPSLENLSLQLICSNDATLMELANYAAASSTLLKLELEFDSFRNTEILESFLVRLSAAMIPSLSIKVSRQISVSADTISQLVLSANIQKKVELSGIECPELLQDKSRLNDLRKLCNEDLWIYPIFSDRGARGIYILRGCYETSLVREVIGNLVKFSRLLAGYKLTEPLRVPTEIILPIFMFRVLEAEIFNSSRLKVITRCLADQRTLGEVNSTVVKMDAAVLYRKCLGVLKKLE